MTFFFEHNDLGTEGMLMRFSRSYGISFVQTCFIIDKLKGASFFCFPSGINRANTIPRPENLFVSLEAPVLALGALSVDVWH